MGPIVVHSSRQVENSIYVRHAIMIIEIYVVASNISLRFVAISEIDLKPGRVIKLDRTANENSNRNRQKRISFEH